MQTWKVTIITTVFTALFAPVLVHWLTKGVEPNSNLLTFPYHDLGKDVCLFPDDIS